MIYLISLLLPFFQSSLPRAKACGFVLGFFGEACSLRQIIFEREAIVENVAGTTLDIIAPTMDLLLSSDSLIRNSVIQF